MKTNANEALVGLVLFLSAIACSKRDEPKPAPIPLPAPTPPPATPIEPAAPPRPTVVKGPPEGIVVDAWVAGGQCNLEKINDPAAGTTPIVLKGSTRTKVTGWALDPKGADLPDAVHVRFLSPTAGDYFGTVTNRFARDDVVAALKVPSQSSKCGFELDFDSDLLAPGNYTVTVVMRFGEKVYICDNGRRLTREP